MDANIIRPRLLIQTGVIALRKGTQDLKAKVGWVGVLRSGWISELLFFRKKTKKGKSDGCIEKRS